MAGIITYIMDRPTFPIGVNVFVVKNGKILLGKRKNVAGHGDWGLPGGHLEKNEKMEDGALRELEEETGLKANLKFINLTNGRGVEPQYIHVGFLAEKVIGKPQLKEPEKCSEWKWFDLNELPTNLFIGHKKSIKAFIKNKEFSD